MDFQDKIGKSNATQILMDFIIRPVGAGLYGFAGFFLVIVISKFLGNLLGTVNTFKVDLSDVTLSLLGFFFVFLINLLKNFQRKTE